MLRFFLYVKFILFTSLAKTGKYLFLSYLEHASAYCNIVFVWIIMFWVVSILYQEAVQNIGFPMHCWHISKSRETRSTQIIQLGNSFIFFLWHMNIFKKKIDYVLHLKQMLSFYLFNKQFWISTSIQFIRINSINILGS